KATSSGSAEVRRSVERLLKTCDRLTLAGIDARPVRAVEVLVQIGPPAARELLTILSRGAPEARLTREAAASLPRHGGAGRPEREAVRKKIRKRACPRGARDVAPLRETCRHPSAPPAGLIGDGNFLSLSTRLPAYQYRPGREKVVLF